MPGATASSGPIRLGVPLRLCRRVAVPPWRKSTQKPHLTVIRASKASLDEGWGMASDRCAGKAAALSLTGLEILIVEDNAAVASAMRSLLEEVGMQVVGVAASVSEADALCSSRPPQIAVVDVQLGCDMAFGLIDSRDTRPLPGRWRTAPSSCKSPSVGRSSWPPFTTPSRPRRPLRRFGTPWFCSGIQG